jgi:phosphoenolpyruvate carboxylase
LPYYAKTNIGSRPAKRGNQKEFRFEDLRAIPFVGSWSQSKQNVPGFYGVGTALECLKKEGDFEAVKELYRSSKFFRTLIANSMMSLTKSFFQLTSYIREDATFGAFWELIYEEYQRSQQLLLELTSFEQLMQNEPAGKASIEVREEIVQPLLTIQQFGLMRLRELQGEKGNSKEIQRLENLITRSMFGNINASRNSA